jgi:hypothetical protein
MINTIPAIPAVLRMAKVARIATEYFRLKHTDTDRRKAIVIDTRMMGKVHKLVPLLSKSA